MLMSMTLSYLTFKDPESLMLVPVGIGSQIFSYLNTYAIDAWFSILNVEQCARKSSLELLHGFLTTIKPTYFEYLNHLCRILPPSSTCFDVH